MLAETGLLLGSVLANRLNVFDVQDTGWKGCHSFH